MKKLLNSQGLLLFLTLAAALAGALLRRYQLANELLSDGTLVPGSKIHIVLIVLLVLYAAAVIALLRPLRKKRSWQEVFPANRPLNLAQIVCALTLFAGNLFVLLQGTVTGQSVASAFSVVLAKLLPWLAFLAAGCMAAFAGMRMSGQKPSALLYMAVSVYLVVRLILNFQTWNTDPSIHDYGFRLLAAIFCMLGTYQLAGFCLDQGRRRMTAFWTLCAVVCSAIGFTDAVFAGNAGEALVSAALGGFMFVNSVQEPPHPVFQEDRDAGEGEPEQCEGQADLPHEVHGSVGIIPDV